MEEEKGFLAISCPESGLSGQEIARLLLFEKEEAKIRQFDHSSLVRRFEPTWPMPRASKSRPDPPASSSRKSLILSTLQHILTGSVLGLSAGLAPGPMLALVLSQTLRYSTAEGVKASLAPLVTDPPIILACLLL